MYQQIRKLTSATHQRKVHGDFKNINHWESIPLNNIPLLERIYQWRDEKARAYDAYPSFIINNYTLIDIAGKGQIIGRHLEKINLVTVEELRVFKSLVQDYSQKITDWKVPDPPINRSNEICNSATHIVGGPPDSSEDEDGFYEEDGILIYSGPEKGDQRNKEVASIATTLPEADKRVAFGFTENEINQLNSFVNSSDDDMLYTVFNDIALTPIEEVPTTSGKESLQTEETSNMEIEIHADPQEIVMMEREGYCFSCWGKNTGHVSGGCPFKKKPRPEEVMLQIQDNIKLHKKENPEFWQERKRRQRQNAKRNRRTRRTETSREHPQPGRGGDQRQRDNLGGQCYGRGSQRAIYAPKKSDCRVLK